MLDLRAGGLGPALHFLPLPLEVFGSRGIASEGVSGKRGISKAQAKKLAELFHVPADLFF